MDILLLQARLRRSGRMEGVVEGMARSSNERAARKMTRIKATMKLIQPVTHPLSSSAATRQWPQFS